MPIEGKSLEAVSQKFCNQLNHLLAKTICQKPLVLLRTQNLGNLAFRRPGVDVETAQLKSRKFGNVGLYVGVLCGAVLSGRNKVRLFISRYKYTLTAEGATEPFCRWEYVKNWPRPNGDHWCRHHLQGTIPLSIGNHTISLNDLHLPTGYVTLEDVIRFCIADLKVKPLSSDWHNVLQRSYQEFKREPFDC